MTTTTHAVPDHPIPAGGHATEWVDLNHPGDGFRSVVSQGHVVDGEHFVQAHVVQESSDGSLVEPCIRAQVDLWDMNVYNHWDNMLTPEQARQQAAELRASAEKLTRLAVGFEAAADAIDGWMNR